MLLVVSVFLLRRRRPTVYTVIPMIFMLAVTLVAMVIKIGDWIGDGNYLLITIGSIILVAEIWLVVEGLAVFLRKRDTPAE